MKLAERDPDAGYFDTHLWLPKRHVSEVQIASSLYYNPRRPGDPLIRAWDDAPDHFLVPRNYVPYAALDQLSFPVYDTRFKDFPEVNITSNFVPDKQSPGQTFQQDGVVAMHGTLDGILCLRCGGGKTVAGLHAAAATGHPILIVVNELSLVRQWKEQIAWALNLPPGATIGQIGDGKFDWEHEVTIAVINSLARRAQEGKLPTALTHHFDPVIVDECVAEGSLVRMADGTELPIERVTRGDWVATPLGPRQVRATARSTKECVPVTSRTRSDLWITPNHPVAWKRIYGLQSVWETPLQTRARSGRDGTSELQGLALVYRGRSVPDLRRDRSPEESWGASSVVFGERGFPARLDDPAERGGYTRKAATGACRCGQEAPREATALVEGPHASEQPDAQPGRTAARDGHNQGHDEERRSDSVWSGSRGEGNFGHAVRSQSLGAAASYRLRAGDIYPGGTALAPEDRGPVLHRGLPAQVHAGGSGDRRILTPELCSEREGPHQGSHSDVAGILGAALPGDIRAIRAASEGPARPVHIDLARREWRTVYDLQIDEAECFYANDLLVHNCHILGAPYFNSAIPLFPGRRWGLSATPRRNDHYDSLIEYTIGRVAYEFLLPELVPNVYFLRLETRIPPTKKAREAVSDMNGEFHHLRCYGYLATLRQRTEQIAREIRVAMSKGRKVLVLTHSRAMCDALAAHFPDGGGVVHGDIGASKRFDIIRNSNPLIAIMQVGKQALDKPELDTLIVCDPFTNPNILQQTMGRLLRIFAGKKRPSVIFVEDYRIDELRAACSSMKRTLSRWPISKGGAIGWRVISPSKGATT